MMPFIAEATNDVPVEIAKWLACLVFMVGLFNLCHKAYKNISGKKPHPPNEQLDQSQKAVIERVDKVEERIDEVARQQNSDREEGEKTARVRSAGIYSKLEDVRKEMKNDLEKQTSTLQERIDRMPEKLVNLLRNTGAIGGKHD